MRKVAYALLAVAMVSPIAILASPAGAAPPAISCTTYSYSETFTPPMPAKGNPATVTSHIDGTETFGGCVGLGITGGTVVFSGQTQKPMNCNIYQGSGLTEVGTQTITWSTGQTSTVDTNGGFGGGGGPVIGGLFNGAFFSGTGLANATTPICKSGPLVTDSWAGIHVTLALAAGSVGCAPAQACSATRVALASATSPGLNVTVTGTPALGSASVTLKIGSGSLLCPNLAKRVRPLANLTDDLKPTDTLSVTARLPLASATSAEQVCFNSKVPYKSQSDLTHAKPGTAYLANCTQVANTAPCVTSSQQVGTDVVVQFILPGGDPRFSIVLPKGRQLWLSHFGAAKAGAAFSAQLQSSGGIGAVHWKVTSGTLPSGCTLNAGTGAIAGKPTTKGSYSVVVQATDSERPPKIATMSIPITVN